MGAHHPDVPAGRQVVKPGDRVKVKGHRGVWTLRKETEGGWWAVGPSGNVRPIRLEDIKEGRR